MYEQIREEEMAAWSQMQGEIAKRLQESLDEDEIRAEVEHRRVMVDAYLSWAPPDGTVVVFERVFYASDNAYPYAALYHGGRWYVTGRKSPQGVDSRGLAMWLVGSLDAHPVPHNKVRVVWHPRVVTVQDAAKGGA